MIIVVKPGASDSQVHEIIDVLEKNELKAHVSEGSERLIIGVIGDKSRLTPGSLEVLSGVEKIVFGSIAPRSHQFSISRIDT